jgi:hypothetical protein
MKNLKMRQHELPMLPIHESKNSEKVIRFATSIERYVSKSYYKRILKAHENGDLYGLYFTKTGRIKAIINN